MKPYSQLAKEELAALKKELEKQFKEVKAKGLKLDMSRGKPSKAQLDLSCGLMDVLKGDSDLVSSDGVDCRNYGILDGIFDARKLLADMSEVPERSILIYGNSSLNVMFDTISRAMTHGFMGSTPWSKLNKVKFLCPVPGYDRHFAITEFFGIEMINVPLLEDGPDMDMVEKLVSEDTAIKGIWCVPKYANPTGISYSDEVVRRLANLKPAAKGFRIFWDNAYAVHHLYEGEENQDQILDIIEECEKAGNPDLVYEFASTSKITFSGSGVAAIAASKANLDFIKKQMSVQTIGFDKINQLRHARYFKNFDGIKEHMMKHAEKMRPKFQAVLDMLEAELKPTGIGQWTNPRGGYFISLDVMEGCAKKVVSMCKDAGMVLTGAGAPFPYGKDPEDKNIRIAPSYATPEELKEASKILIVCTKIAAIEKILNI